jgi:hypothetical protein
MIDAVHKRPAGTAARNFRENRERFIEGVEFRLTKFVDLQKSGFLNPNPNGMTLITESGYLMLVKSLTDARAWAVQRELVKSYFRAKQQPAKTSEDDMLASLTDKAPATETALSRASTSAVRISDSYKSLDS